MIMRKNILAALATVVAISSCSTKELVPDSSAVKDDSGAPSFTAEISNISTRTTLADGSSSGKKKVNWDASDRLCVAFTSKSPQGDAGYFLGSYTVTPDGDNPSKALLSAASSQYELNTENPQSVIAIYPESVSILHMPETINNLDGRKDTRETSEFAGDIMNYVMTVNFPSVQTWDLNDVSYAPMVGLSDGKSPLKFYNLSSILAIEVPYSQMPSVDSIKVTADKYIAGLAYPQVSDSGEPFMTMEKDSQTAWMLGCPLSKTIMLDCGGVEIPEEGSVTFYVAVPAAEYGFLRFDVYGDHDGSRMVTKDGATISLARNKVYDIDFNGRPFVEIGGKIWSKINLGATTVAGSYETCYGDYYAWGEVTPRYTGITFTSKSEAKITGWTSEHPNGYQNIDYPKYTKNSLDASHDAAVVAWGDNWHTPSKQDFVDLLAACSDGTDAEVLSSSKPKAGIYWVNSTQTYIAEFTGAAGFLFIPKEDPAKRLFFPAAGSIGPGNYNGGATYGHYYASEKPNTYYAYSMRFFNRNYPNKPTVNPTESGYYRFYGFTIRPVADE